MATLSQILAVEKGAKARVLRDFTDLHRRTTADALLVGRIRTYQPRDDDGEREPDQSQKVQLNLKAALAVAADTLTGLFDVTAAKDWANCDARADVVVDGVTLLDDVPATYLLFLEKQLADVHTFVAKLPVLSPAQEWHWDENRSAYVSEPVVTVSTKKTPKALTTAPATDRHPAQVHVYTEDVPVGEWTTRLLSGALPADLKRDILARVVKLADAVKVAREEANRVTVPDVRTGKRVFDYILAR